MLKYPLLFHDQQLVNACTPTKTSQMLCPTALATLPVSRNHVRLCVSLYRTWNVIAEAKTGNEYIYSRESVIRTSIIRTGQLTKHLKSYSSMCKHTKIHEHTSYFSFCNRNFYVFSYLNFSLIRTPLGPNVFG